LAVVIAVTAATAGFAGQTTAAQEPAKTAPAQKNEPAPRVPVEDDIVKQTLSAESPYFYPRMMARYMAGDETLTADHYYYLYYGYAYDDSYDAHRELPGMNAMLEVFARTSTPSREDALAIIEAGRSNMLVDPFSPSNLNMMTWAYEIAGDTLSAVKSAARFRGVVEAIESSGTGLRESSPMHILRFEHANDLAAAYGFKIVNRQVRSTDVEYLQFDRNSARVRGWFFDFSRVYWKPYEGERRQRKSNWEFNGIPL
jgi:hypothetical protein